MRAYIPPKTKLIPEQAELRFAGEIFDVYQWPQELYDGTTATFEMLRRHDTAVVVAIKDSKIVITRQKQPRKDWFYAYPGGRVDDSDANELAGAKRELREETGMEFANWKLIAVAQPYAKIDWLVYTFLATDFIKQGQQSLDGGEVIEILELAFAEFMELIHRPDTDYLRFDFPGLENIKTFADLKNLPALYQYS